jgi:hypothetical protein
MGIEHRPKSEINPPATASCCHLADQFKSIGEEQGVAFSGRCAPPQPQAESKLSPKPPKHRAKPSRMTQEKARRCNTIADLGKSTGWRFESSPVHQLFYFQHIKLLLTSVW